MTVTNETEKSEKKSMSFIEQIIVNDLERLEKRIECDEDGVEFEIEIEDDVEYLYANITYKIIKYNTYYTSKVKVGEVSNG